MTDHAEHGSVDGTRAEVADIDRAVESCVRSQEALLAFLRADETDPSHPSVLPGWTIGHVLTHIARNGDSIVSLLDGHDQYPHGRDGRNADIEAGAPRRWNELVDDVASTADAVAARLHAVVVWTGSVRMIGGDRPTALVPLLRQREVEVHRADLGLGHRFDDMPEDYVRRDLQVMGALWATRRSASLPDAAQAAAPPARLAWLMGRRDLDGLEPADLF